MAQVAIAAGAEDFGAGHAVAFVRIGGRILLGLGLKKAGLAGTEVELAGGEQRPERPQKSREGNW